MKQKYLLASFVLALLAAVTQAANEEEGSIMWSVDSLSSMQAKKVPNDASSEIIEIAPKNKVIASKMIKSILPKVKTFEEENNSSEGQDVGSEKKQKLAPKVSISEDEKNSLENRDIQSNKMQMVRDGAPDEDKNSLEDKDIQYEKVEKNSSKKTSSKKVKNAPHEKISDKKAKKESQKEKALSKKDNKHSKNEKGSPKQMEAVSKVKVDVYEEDVNSSEEESTKSKAMKKIKKNEKTSSKKATKNSKHKEDSSDEDQNTIQHKEDASDEDQNTIQTDSASFKKAKKHSKPENDASGDDQNSLEIENASSEKVKKNSITELQMDASDEDVNSLEEGKIRSKTMKKIAKILLKHPRDAKKILKNNGIADNIASIVGADAKYAADFVAVLSKDGTHLTYEAAHLVERVENNALKNAASLAENLLGRNPVVDIFRAITWNIRDGGVQGLQILKSVLHELAVGGTDLSRKLADLVERIAHGTSDTIDTLLPV